MTHRIIAVRRAPLAAALRLLGAAAPDVSGAAARATSSTPTAVDVPDRPATQFLGAQLTFLDLKQRSDALAAALARLGIAKGDRVGIMLPNCPQYIIAAFAILRLGAIVVNINPSYTAREVLTVAADSGVRIADHARRAGAAGARRSRADRDRARSSSRRWPSTRAAAPRAARRRHADAGGSARRIACRRTDLPRVDDRSATTSPCCSTPAARPARRKARC